MLDPYPLWSARRPAPARFRREDFMGDPARPLAECARDAVEAETGARPAGPVRLLAGLRYLGHSFNPVSFYYCFDAAGERVEAVVADVENIPWGERHLTSSPAARRGTGAERRARQGAPRLAADGDGPDLCLPRQRAGRRGSRSTSSRARASGDAATRKSFDATLSLRRRELSRPLLAAAAGPLPGDVAAGGGEDLRPGAAAEAEGRALLPAPARAGGRRGSSRREGRARPRRGLAR